MNFVTVSTLFSLFEYHLPRLHNDPHHDDPLSRPAASMHETNTNGLSSSQGQGKCAINASALHFYVIVIIIVIIISIFAALSQFITYRTTH